LGILLHLDKDVVTGDSLKESPFAKYAAEHWADHARLEDVLPNVEDGMKQLFDPRKSHLRSAFGYMTQLHGEEGEEEESQKVKGHYYPAKLRCIMPLFGTYCTFHSQHEYGEYGDA
jgi:hypothetical protein